MSLDTVKDLEKKYLPKTAPSGSSTAAFEMDVTQKYRDDRSKSVARSTFSASSAFGMYDEAKKRTQLHGNEAAKADEMRRATDRLYSMGFTQSDVSEYEGAGAKGKAAVTNKMEAKREALQKFKGASPDKMVYDQEKGMWTQPGYKPQEAPASGFQFKGFTSDAHADQMQQYGYRMPGSADTGSTQEADMSSAQRAKLSFSTAGQMDSSGASDPIFKTIESLGLKKDANGVYHADAAQVKELRKHMDERNSAILGDAQFGAKISTKLNNAANGDYTASFTPVTINDLENGAKGSRDKFMKSAYGQGLEKMARTLTQLDTVGRIADEGQAPGTKSEGQQNFSAQHLRLRSQFTDLMSRADNPSDPHSGTPSNLGALMLDASSLLDQSAVVLKHQSTNRIRALEAIAKRVPVSTDNY
jgi:hypothetical protein